MSGEGMIKILFVVGLIIAITAAALVFFVGTEKLGFWPMVMGIIGIGLIGASGATYAGKMTTSKSNS